MNELVKLIGQRLRNYRTQLGMSQEKVAELSGCHPTYIGQLERGEKNATIESIGKIAAALQIPLSQLFEKADELADIDRNIPLECYELLARKSRREQEFLYRIMVEISEYKETDLR